MKKSIVISLLFSAIALSFASPVFAGLGISPSEWIEPHSLVGQQMSKTFVLSRSDAAEDLYFTSQITGDINAWIKIDNGDSFVMPKGTQELPVKIIITIPADAPFKEYKGEIRLNSATKAVAGSSAPIGILLSSLIRIDLTISDKLFSNYSILQIAIPKQEQNNLLNVNLKIWNQGNVLVKPTKLTMDIFDKFNTTKLGSETFMGFLTVEGVAPFSEGEIKLQIPISLKLTPEQYWAKVDVYQDDAVIKSDDVTFDVAGAPGQVATTTNNQPKTNNWWALVTIQNVALVFGGIVILLLIISGIWFLAKKSRKNKIEPIVASGAAVGVGEASLQNVKDARKKVIKEIEEDIDEFLEEKMKE